MFLILGWWGYCVLNILSLTSGPWKQDPTPIAIPSNTVSSLFMTYMYIFPHILLTQRGQFQSSRPPGTNPYAAGRLTDTLKSKRDARSRSGNRTTQATILETSKPRPHKRQRVDLNRPGESQNSEASCMSSFSSQNSCNAVRYLTDLATCVHVSKS